MSFGRAGRAEPLPGEDPADALECSGTPGRAAIQITLNGTAAEMIKQEKGGEQLPLVLALLKATLPVPKYVPVLPRGHDFAPVKARGCGKHIPKSMFGIGVGHELGVVSNRPIRHNDNAWHAVFENLRTIAVLAPVMRRNEYIHTPEEVLHRGVLQQSEPTFLFEVPAENKRDIPDVEESKQAQIIRIGKGRIVVVKDPDLQARGLELLPCDPPPIEESIMPSSSFIAGLRGGVFSERMSLLVMLGFRVSIWTWQFRRTASRSLM